MADKLVVAVMDNPKKKYFFTVDERVDMINKTGRRPEQDIKTTHIDNVKKELQNAEQKFIQKYSTQNIR